MSKYFIECELVLDLMYPYPLVLYRKTYIFGRVGKPGVHEESPLR